MKYEPVNTGDKCPICGAQSLEVAIVKDIDNEGNEFERKQRERCARGCYIYDFDLKQRVK